MSKIDDLIRTLCPEGVKSLDLGSLCRIETGKRDANESVENGEFLFFTTARESSRIDSFRWDCEALLVAGNANVGNVKHYIGKFDAYQRTYVLTEFLEGMDAKYLYYALQNNLNFYLDSNKNVAAMTYIVLGTLKAFKVPIPPQKIQKEIVSILDKFTQLEAELEAELEARKTQYEVTRDRLLDFSGDLSAHPMGEMFVALCPEGIELHPLGKFGEFVRGSGLEKKDLLTEGLPVVHYGEVHTHYGFWTQKTKSFISETKAKSMKKAAPGDVVLVTTSENEEDVAKPLAWLGTTDLNVGGESYIFKSELDPYFCAQMFLSHGFKKQMRKHISGTKVKRISSSNLEKVLVAVPPLAVQRAIGENLKNLDSLVTDIKYGLPAEIEARRKQYEYYRNKLLTFKEMDAA